MPSHHASSDEPYDPDRPPISERENLRDQIYNSAAQEKTARAAEFSAIKRAVSKDNIVIADGLNYIKGYRYQLWCEAKAAGTRCCVVHVAAQEDECKNWNRERLRAWGRLGNDNDDGIPSQAPRGNKQGKDVLGDLVPESHTAIYGDRVSRSRSSSLDGEQGVDAERKTKAKAADDTMTLKSLYISDRWEQPDQPTTRAAPQTPSEPSSSQPAAVSLPSAHTERPAPTAAPPYSPATLRSLCMRYEPPSPFSRWDTPLFTIPASDSTPPTQAIWAALVPPPTKPTSKKALSQLPSSHIQEGGVNNGGMKQVDPGVKPHAATVLPKATASDALQILESATMDVTRHVLTRARELGGPADGDGGDVALSIPTPTPADPEASYETTLHVPLGIALSQPLLQRLRRKYTQIQRGGIAHGQGYVHGRRGVVEGFIEFLEREWNETD